MLSIVFIEPAPRLGRLLSYIALSREKGTADRPRVASAFCTRTLAQLPMTSAMHFRTETISKYPNSWLEYSSPQIEKGFSGMRNCCCGVRSADRKQGTIGGRRSLRRGSFAEAPSLSRNAEMKLKPNLIRLAQGGPCTCKIRKWNKVSHCNGQPPLK